MNNICISWYNVDVQKWSDAVEPFVDSVLTALGHTNWDMSVVFCDDPFIHSLNKNFRRIDAPTDILSFEQADEYYSEQGEKRLNAGDLIISLDSLKANAVLFAVSENEELKRLIIHGILHLSGMDHSDNSPEQAMLQLQERILGTYTGTIIYWG